MASKGCPIFYKRYFPLRIFSTKTLMCDSLTLSTKTTPLYHFRASLMLRIEETNSNQLMQHEKFPVGSSCAVFFGSRPQAARLKGTSLCLLFVLELEEERNGRGGFGWWCNCYWLEDSVVVVVLVLDGWRVETKSFSSVSSFVSIEMSQWWLGDVWKRS